MSWIVGSALGYAAGTGFNRLVEHNQVKRALDPRLYQPVPPPLPIERWSFGGDVCAIGIPAGWRDMTDHELRRQSTEARARVVLGACVESADPRLGLSATSFTVLDRGPGSAGPDAY